MNGVNFRFQRKLKRACVVIVHRRHIRRPEEDTSNRKQVDCNEPASGRVRGMKLVSTAWPFRSSFGSRLSRTLDNENDALQRTR